MICVAFSCHESSRQTLSVTDGIFLPPNNRDPPGNKVILHKSLSFAWCSWVWFSSGLKTNAMIPEP